MSSKPRLASTVGLSILALALSVTPALGSTPTASPSVTPTAVAAPAVPAVTVATDPTPAADSNPADTPAETPTDTASSPADSVSPTDPASTSTPTTTTTTTSTTTTTTATTPPPTWTLPVQPAPCTPKNGIPAMCVTLENDDPSQNTQSYLDSDKELSLKSVVDVVDPTGTYPTIAYTSQAAPTEIHGRGNFTWLYLPKKPYQIKFDKKTSVLGMAANKKWVLLANHADPSLMRNMTAFSFARDLGFANAPEYRYVDLYVNGSYRGNYQVTEKVEVQTSRVELKSNNGVLLEMDNNYYADEPYWFRASPSGTEFTLKDAKLSVPDKVTSGTQTPLTGELAAGWAQAQDRVQELDKLLYATGSQTLNWSRISEIIDVDSFVKYYFVNELTENPEITRSSIYFYYDPALDCAAGSWDTASTTPPACAKLHAGPVWDYDSSLKNYSTEMYGADPVSDYTNNAYILRQKSTALDTTHNEWYARLFRAEQFAQQANAFFDSTVSGALDKLPGYIDSTKATILASANANFATWSVLGTTSPMQSNRVFGSTYSSEVQRLRDFVTARATFLKSKYGASVPLIQLSADAKGKGWQFPSTESGQITGTVGQSIPMDAFKMNVSGSVAGSINATVHFSSLGWVGPKVASSSNAAYSSWPQQGTVNSWQMEAVKFTLSGDLAKYYDIEYRAHVAGNGWMAWVRNGAQAGTTGQALSLQALQVRLIKKSGVTPPTSTTTTTTSTPPTSTTTTTTTAPAALSHTSYRVHQQAYGWGSTVTDGAQAGIISGYRLEALQLSITGGQYTGGVTYRAHVSGVGWQSYVSNGATAGTTGQSLRMEAVQIYLTGELANHYNIEYRMYVKGIGWQGWVRNNAVAGTTGQALQTEALQIRLVAK